MNKIRKGDHVVVLTGRDKGRRGAVVKVLGGGRRGGAQVVVEGVNTVKKHQRPNPQAGQQGGIIDREMPLALSKVAIWNATTKKADRVGFRTLGDGRKVRYFKSNDENIDT